MSNTHVTLKPGCVIGLVVISTAVVAAGIIGLRGRGGGNSPVTTPTVATDVAPAGQEIVDEPGMTTGEARDKEVLASLNAAPGQARDWLFLGPLLSGSAIVSVTNNMSDAATMRKIISTSYLPTEAKYRAQENLPATLVQATCRWRKANGAAFNFKQIFNSKETPFSTLTNVVVYGYMTIESKGATQKNLRFRSDDGAIV